MTAAGLPPDVHPAVAAVITQTERLQQVLDAQLQKMNTETFTATDEAETVEVTVDGHHNLADVFVADGLLRNGVHVVQERVNEALTKALALADDSINADNEHLNGVLADITAQLESNVPGLVPPSAPDR